MRKVIRLLFIIFKKYVNVYVLCTIDKTSLYTYVTYVNVNNSVKIISIILVEIPVVYVLVKAIRFKFLKFWEFYKIYFICYSFAILISSYLSICM